MQHMACSHARCWLAEEGSNSAQLDLQPVLHQAVQVIVCEFLKLALQVGLGRLGSHGQTD